MFSIIVPSFNRAAEIPKLLDNLNQQTIKNFEVIIVDDCSIEAVKIPGVFNFPITVVRNEINQGAAQSRNIGAAQARNDWLIFLDDDDRFLADKCEILTNVISENKTVNFIYHPAQCEMVNEKFSYFTKPFSDIANLTLNNLLRANKIGGMPMIALKKSLFWEVNGLSTQLRSLEDYEFLLKLIQHNEFSPFFIDKPLTICHFFTQRKSVSTDTTNTQKAIDYISNHYVTNQYQQLSFNQNAQTMLAYPYLMNLSRKAAYYYFKLFKMNKNIKNLIIAMIIFISPKWAIQLK